MKRRPRRLLTLSISMLLGLVARDAWATATMVVDGGAGFSDSTPVAPVGGNTGTTLGAQRLIALQYAADIWGGVLTSTEVIRIRAAFTSLPCSPTSGVLGFFGPSVAFRDFAGAPLAGTWYPVALANAITNSDLCPPASACTTAGFDSDDLEGEFQDDIGTAGCLTTQSFYYGLDANPGVNQIDIVTVMLHEIGHGVGFGTLVNVSTGAKASGFDDTYMLLLEDHSTGESWPTMTDGERQASAIDSPGGTSDLHWTGASVVAAGAGLTGGRHSSGHILMYAPNPVEPGSSVSHFDVSVTPDEIMEPAYTVANHDLGLSDDLMEDIGWTIGVAPTLTPTPTSAPPTPTLTPAPPATCGATPIGGCDGPGKGIVLIKNETDNLKDKFIWKWLKGPLTTQAQFGNPDTGTTSYTLCVYDDDNLETSLVVPAGINWNPISTKGYKYKDTSGSVFGITKILMKGGDPGKSKILVKGKGGTLPQPALMFSQTVNVTLQLLRNDSSQCWETEFLPPATSSSGTQFKDKF